MSIEQDTIILASDVTTSLSGKAPTSHASTKTTYGIGTGSNYGHVKLSDSTSSTSAASSGIAASPKAVKAAYDLANGKQDKLGYTPVKSVNGVNVDANGNVDIASLASGWGMPSKTQQQNLTIGSSGAQYTAPANGWFQAVIEVGNNKYTTLINETNGISSIIVGTAVAGTMGRLFIPASKGDVVRLHYNTTIDADDLFIFKYAYGEVF